MTNVKNRRALDDTIQTQFALMARYETPFSLVIFDIDHFKRINDEQGHLHGDRMLQDLARLLDEYVRETDIVTRYGGDEFVVVMPQTDHKGACILSERLRANVQEKLSLTVSGGVSSCKKAIPRNHCWPGPTPHYTRPKIQAEIAFFPTMALM